jgi:hypothetical protein
VKCLAHHHVNQKGGGGGGGGESSQYHKGHDGNIITCAFFNPRWRVTNRYIALDWLLFLQEQTKNIIIMRHATVQIHLMRHAWTIQIHQMRHATIQIYPNEAYHYSRWSQMSRRSHKKLFCWSLQKFYLTRIICYLFVYRLKLCLQQLYTMMHCPRNTVMWTPASMHLEAISVLFLSMTVNALVALDTDVSISLITSSPVLILKQPTSFFASSHITIAFTATFANSDLLLCSSACSAFRCAINL